MRPFRRRTYIVNELQGKYVICNSLFLAIYTLLVLCLTFMPTISALFSTSPLAQRFEASKLFFTLTNRLWPAVIIAFPVYIMGTIYYSHKVFGPIKKIYSFVNALSQGDLSVRIKLREGDVLKEIFDKLNDAIEKTEKKVREKEESENRIKKAIEELKAEIGSKKFIVTEDNLKLINEKISELENLWKKEENKSAA